MKYPVWLAVLLLVSAVGCSGSEEPEVAVVVHDHEFVHNALPFDASVTNLQKHWGGKLKQAEQAASDRHYPDSDLLVTVGKNQFGLRVRNGEQSLAGATIVDEQVELVQNIRIGMSWSELTQIFPTQEKGNLLMVINNSNTAQWSFAFKNDQLVQITFVG